MISTQKQHETDALVHWTYSQEEWRIFMRWKKMKKGMVFYILHLLTPGHSPKIPRVTITAFNICINETSTFFHDAQRQLKFIDIRDAGKINVMEICYASSFARNSVLNKIQIPVPKGRLREAIGVEQKLNAIKTINQPG